MDLDILLFLVVVFGLFIHNIFYMIFIALLAMPITLLSIKVVKSQYWLIVIVFSIYTVLFGILIPLLLT